MANETTASRPGAASAMDVEAAGFSSSSSSLSDPPSNPVTPEAVNQARGGMTAQDVPQHGSSTIGGATTDPTEAESHEEDGPPGHQDDSRTAFDQKVQRLLLDLEDEVGVDLLLNSGDHDDPECLAVKVIWQQRKIDGMAEQINRLEEKVKDMSAMTLEVMGKQLHETGAEEEKEE